MNNLARIGVAVPDDLLEKFDQLIEQRGYANRSEAFRDLIRDALVQEIVVQPKQEVVGTLTLVYDHHARQLQERLIGQQHDHFEQIVSTLHVHLDHDNCLEVLVLRGEGTDVKAIADRLIAAKGIRHGKLVLTATDAPKARR